MDKASGMGAEDGKDREQGKEMWYGGVSLRSKKESKRAHKTGDETKPEKNFI